MREREREREREEEKAEESSVQLNEIPWMEYTCNPTLWLSILTLYMHP